MDDPYRLHRVALAPFIAEWSDGLLAETTAIQLHAIEEHQFLQFVAQQGLAPLWHELLTDKGLDTQLSARSIDALAECRREAAAHYLLQKVSLAEIREVLDAQAITHAVYKGVAERERLYENAALRPAADIDLLVYPNNRDRAISNLVQVGYALRPKAENVSHEVNLQRGALTIDLHWDILRPGRTREPIVNALLAERQDAGDHWALSTAGALFVALVHPVFAKYATAPQSTLIRMLDLRRQLALAGQATDATLKLLERGGVKTAAWIMLCWLVLLTEHACNEGSSPAAVLLQQKTAPGALRRGYLSMWLRHNLPARLQRSPLVVQLAFTAVAHDRLNDARNAISTIRRAEKTQTIDLQRLEVAAAAGGIGMNRQ